MTAQKVREMITILGAGFAGVHFGNGLSQKHFPMIVFFQRSVFTAGGSMVEIQLTRGMTSFVDDAFAHLNQWKWHAAKDKKNWYAARAFTKDDGTQGLMFMHWAIIGQPLNRKMVTDHINGNGLFNSSDNLRHVSSRGNSSNRKYHREGGKSSKYVGVCWKKRDKKWGARAWLNGKYKHLGFFEDEKEASNAYQTAILQGDKTW